MGFQKNKFIFLLALITALLVVALPYTPSLLLPEAAMAQTSRKDLLDKATEAYQKSNYDQAKTFLQDALDAVFREPPEQSPSLVESQEYVDAGGILFDQEDEDSKTTVINLGELDFDLSDISSEEVPHTSPDDNSWLTHKKISDGNINRQLGDIKLLQGKYSDAFSSYEEARQILLPSQNPRELSCQNIQRFSKYFETLYDLGLSSFELARLTDDTQKSQALAISESVLVKAFEELPVFKYAIPVDSLVDRESQFPFLNNEGITNITPITRDFGFYTREEFIRRESELGAFLSFTPNVGVTGAVEIYTDTDGDRKIGIDFGIEGIIRSREDRENSYIENNYCQYNLPNQIETRMAKLLQQVLIAQDKDNAAFLIAEAGRAIEIDKIIAKHLEDFKPERANFFERLALSDINQYAEIAHQENSTIINYSVISDQEIYIWVLQPSRNLVFRKVDCTQNAQELSNSDSSFEICQILKGENLGIENTSQPGDRGYAAFRRREIVRNVRNTLKWDWLQSRSNQLVTDSSDPDEELKNLYKLLISSIEDLLPPDETAHIVFIPDDVLFFVPFPALKKDDGSYLIDHHTIRVAPNLRSLVLSQDRDESLFDKRKALVIANPDEVVNLPEVNRFAQYGDDITTLPKLPWAENEAVEVSNRLKFVGEDRARRQERFEVDLRYEGATRDEVLNQLEQVSVAHFAMHALVENPSDVVCNRNFPDQITPYSPDQLITHCSSSIWNSNPQSITGQLSINKEDWLSSLDLLDLNLSNVDLTVLSACNTARGRLIPGGVAGLPFSLNLAGARNTVSSIATVPDTASTVYLMKTFYRQLQNDDGPVDMAQALRQAMISTRDFKDPKNGKTPYTEPRYWASFTLSGSGK